MKITNHVLVRGFAVVALVASMNVSEVFAQNSNEVFFVDGVQLTQPEVRGTAGNASSTSSSTGASSHSGAEVGEVVFAYTLPKGGDSPYTAVSTVATGTGTANKVMSEDCAARAAGKDGGAGGGKCAVDVTLAGPMCKTEGASCTNNKGGTGSCSSQQARNTLFCYCSGGDISPLLDDHWLLAIGGLLGVLSLTMNAFPSRR